MVHYKTAEGTSVLASVTARTTEKGKDFFDLRWFSEASNAFEATSHVPRDKIEAWKPGKTELKNEELALAAINLAEQDIARREEEEPEHAKEEDHKEAKNMLENVTDMLADPSKLLGYFS